VDISPQGIRNDDERTARAQSLLEQTCRLVLQLGNGSRTIARRQSPKFVPQGEDRRQAPIGGTAAAGDGARTRLPCWHYMLAAANIKRSTWH